MAHVTTQTAMQNTKPEGNTARRIIGTMFGVVELALATRLIFRLLGANPSNSLVRWLYAVTKDFVGVFAGIFSPVTAPGLETVATFEPATLIAMLATAVVAWAVLKLMTPRLGSRRESTVTTEQAVVREHTE